MLLNLSNAGNLIQMGQTTALEEHRRALRFVAAAASVVIFVLLGSCQGGAADVVPIPISCGNGVCDTEESCASCASDCGACPNACGDEACAADETCASCSTDCGACPDLCGNEACDASELCSTCEPDCGACPDAVTTITRGPYLQSGSSSSVVVRWRTDENTDSVVAYGVDPTSVTNVVTAATITGEHQVRIEGLAANTRYYYAIGSSTAPLIGADDDHFFTTAPQTGAAVPTRIWVLGDSGTANDNARSVRDAYRSFTGSRGTDLWLMLGDNAYEDGTDDEYQRAVFETYPDTLRNAVLWPTLGNHDGHSADSATQTGPYYDIFTLPTAAEAGGVPSGTEAYYAFDYGNIHFVCLDSYDSNPDPDGAMMTWMENDLAATAQPWIVAFWHHPPYTKGSHDSDAEGRLVDMRELALPILEAYGVDLVLSGHSHSYERSMLLAGHYGASDTLTGAMTIDSGDGREGGDGVYEKPGSTAEGAVYVVAGSSGKTSSAALDHPAMFISLLELGSVVLDVDDARLEATFLDDSGNVQDSFTIQKD
jgi:hypothetical protein